MSVLSTGQPKIEIAKLDKFDNIGEWVEIDVPKDGTTSLETSEGDTTEYLQEGGGKVDVEKKECGYTFVFDLFVKKGFKKPIVDKNGVVVDNYALRLSPKDKECYGLIIYKAQVACISSYSVADGMICQYKFEGLQTDDHDNIWDYWVEETDLKTNVNFVDIPASGNDLVATVTATLGASETLTTTASESWFTATVSDDTVTITATGENTGKRREGWVKLTTSKGKFTSVRVNQFKAESA